MSEIFAGVAMSGIEFEGAAKGGNGLAVALGLRVENSEVVEQFGGRCAEFEQRFEVRNGVGGAAVFGVGGAEVIAGLGQIGIEGQRYLQLANTVGGTKKPLA